MRSCARAISILRSALSFFFASSFFSSRRWYTASTTAHMPDEAIIDVTMAMIICVVSMLYLPPIIISTNTSRLSLDGWPYRGAISCQN